MILSKQYINKVGNLNKIKKSRIPKINQKLSQKSNLNTRVQSSLVDFVVNDGSYFLGKSIILFTMFYCSMNWVFYRRLRKEVEKEAEIKKIKNSYLKII